MPQKRYARRFWPLIALSVFSLLLFSAAAIFLPGTAETAFAASNGGALPDSADYTFAVTIVGVNFAAAEKDGKVPARQDADLPTLLGGIDEAVAALKDDAVKRFTFDTATEIDIAARSVSLNEGTYIIENLKITGNSSYGFGDGVVTVKETADVFITGENTSIRNTDDAGANSVALSNTGTGSLTVLAGRISAVKYAVYNAGAGTVYVSGGEVNSTGNSGSAVYNGGAGRMHISGGVKISAANIGVYNYNIGGRIDISGGARISGGTNSAVSVNNGTVNISGGAKISGGAGSAVHISGGGTVNILEGEISANGSAVYNNGAGTVNISGGEVYSTQGGNIAVRNNAGGTVNISGGLINAAGEDSRGVYNNAAGTVNISGGQIHADDRNCFGIYNNAAGAVYVSGGTVSAAGGGTAIQNNGGGTVGVSSGAVSAGWTAVYNNAGGTVDISGGTISSSNTFAAYNNGEGTLNISGGVLTSPGQTLYNSGDGIINITGGEIKMTDAGYVLMNNGAGTVNISGGTISAAGGGTGVYNSAAGTVNISGGTVSSAAGTAIIISRAGTVCITQAGDKATLITSGASGENKATVDINEAGGRLEIFGGDIINTGGAPLIRNAGGAAVILPQIDNFHEENLTVTATYSSDKSYTLSVGPTTSSPSSAAPGGGYRPVFSAFSVAGFYTYQWYKGEAGAGTMMAGSTQPSITLSAVESSGSYYVMVGTKNLTDYFGLAAAPDVPSGQFTVNISPKPAISASWVSKIPAAVYDGRAHTPEFVVKDGAETLAAGVDYRFSYANNTYAGTADIVISGIGRYAGITIINFTIGKAEGSGSVALAGWKEGGAANTPVARSVIYDAGKAVFEYKAKGAADREYAAGVPEKAGEYTVRARFAATDNYREFATEGVDFTIEKPGLSAGALTGIIAGSAAAAALAGFALCWFAFAKKRLAKGSKAK